MISALFKNLNSEYVLQCMICYRSYTEVEPCSFICGHSCCVECAKQLKKCHMCCESISCASNIKTNYVMKDLVMLSYQLSELFTKFCDEVTIEAAAEKGVSFAQYEVAQKHLASDDIQKSTFYFKLAANQGVIEAHYALWKLLSPVEAAVRSSYSEELLSHLKCCADSGKWSECQYELAQYYEVVDKNTGEAVRYYKLSEDKNNLEAKYRLWQLEQTTYVQFGLCKYLAARGKIDCQYELGLYYYNQGNKEFLKYLKLAADQGHTEAQFELGQLYERVQHSLSEALVYYKLAAARGHSVAAYRVGCIYQHNYEDIMNACTYYQLAAEFGHVHSQSLVAKWYSSGEIETIAIDLSQAFKYHLMAANNGNVDEQNLVAHWYLEGKGTERNLKLATQYFKFSADSGKNSDSQYELGRLYENEHNYDLAFKYYNMAADNKHSQACYVVGQYYTNGLHVDKNETEALRYYKLSNHPPALFQVGLAFYRGIHNKKDLKIAFTNFCNSIECSVHCCKDSYYYVALCYEQGDGTEKNPEKAFKYFKLSADETNNSEAQFNVGLYFWKDNKKLEGFHYLKLSADQGHCFAQFFVGICYLSGESVTLNYVEALKYIHAHLEVKRIHVKFSCSGYLLNCTTLDPSLMQVDVMYNVALEFHACNSGIMAHETRKIAFKYLKLAADKGHLNACLMLIDCYKRELTEDQIMVNPTDHLKYWMVSADNGHVEAQLKTAELLSSDKANAMKSFHYFKLAADAGNTIAKLKIDQYYETW